MKTSFVIIAYNEENTIANCIDSILKQKGLGSYEIVIVNDASKDNTAKVVKEIRSKNINLISLKENKGRGNARDTGVRNTKGEYIAFIDADIVLPKNWLKTCMTYIRKYDAVGGIAVPDGDVAYLYNKFRLKPKTVSHTTEITGSNSLYKKDIFKKIKFNKNLRGGEDTDLSWNIEKNGFKIKAIPNLIVDHREDITYRRSLERISSFGRGATKLLANNRKIRLADLAFFGFLFLLIGNLILLLIGETKYLILIILYPLLTSFLHISSKFKITNISGFIFAGLFNYIFILAYYSGRIVGFFKNE
ncbi:glycosyltransferase [archaeon]|nr:glycosyltransferase [archaeon]